MKSTAEWQIRADQDAFWAVASHEGKRGAWTKEDFYALGESDWADFRRRWREYEPDLGGTSLEIGSGAGRITKWMTQDFTRVIGVDVSPAMIALAQEAAPTAQLLQVSDTKIPVPDASVDAVFTCHVLQHFELSEEVQASLAECRRALRDGGSIMAHLLMADVREPVLKGAVAAARKQVSLIRKRGTGVTIARRYSAGEVRRMFEAAGFRDVELREFRVRSNNDPHTFWLARR